MTTNHKLDKELCFSEWEEKGEIEEILSFCIKNIPSYLGE
jgi:hypothetical protein